MIRTSGLDLQTLSAYMHTVTKHYMHGLNFVLLSMQRAVLIKSLYFAWSFIFSV